MRHDGCCAARAAQAEPVGIYRQIRPQRRRRPRPDIGPVRVVTAEEGKRELVPMRWGLMPRWWSKTIKDACWPSISHCSLTDNFSGAADAARVPHNP